MNWKLFIDRYVIHKEGRFKGGLKHFVCKDAYFDRNFPHFKSISKLVKQNTLFLPFDCGNAERLYCLYHKIEIKKCSICEKNKAIFIDFKKGYRPICSWECYLKFIHKKQDDGMTLGEKRSANAAKTMKNSFICGKSLHQITGEKISKSLNKMCENGLTVSQNSAKKIAKKVGKENYKKRGQKARDTKFSKIDENGRNVYEAIAFKRKNDIDEFGLNLYQRTVRKSIPKMLNTKLKLGPDGLNGFQRGFLNGAGKASILKYYNSSLLYQGTCEKHFLDKLNSLNLLDFIENGITIRYLYNGFKQITLISLICLK